MTWVVLAFNLLMLLWLIAGINGASGEGDSCVDQLCEDANDVGTAIGVGVILFVWATGAVILGVVRMVTNRSFPQGRRERTQRPPQRW
ncbi:hypothetical protein ACIPSE_02780 [Streptomyces sp. NPDC090106]|uniref:hypothetical protein n=1 Tax=Streptomyces sp. NPDC090106 TaxID=3365946 RepID=UPI00382D439E